MIFDLLGSALLYFVISFGLAWPLAARLALAPVEKLGVSLSLSLFGVFVIAWTVYVFDVPTVVLWVIPALAAAALAIGRRSLADTLQDPDAQRLIIAQTIVTSWCISWLALVLNYSGGKWVGDWFGHWQRALFFLHHWPRDLLFNGFDPLPSRPPLANVVTGAFLRVTQVDFAHYQLASTVLSSLAFLPAALLTRRMGGGRVIPLLAVIVMLNPLFVENSTFAWTKLPAAFFTLMGLYFFCRAHDTDPPRCAGWMCAGNLAAALLTHYSAGPYVLLLVLGWLALGWPPRRSSATWWRVTALAAVAGTSVLALWFGWAFAVYGVKGTFLSNTTVTDQAPTIGAQLHVVALNLRDTLVPHFFNGTDLYEFTQRSPWGWWRDWFFLLYQSNLILVFGTVGVATITVAVWRNWSVGLDSRDRWFWVLFIAGVIVLGVGTHGGRENRGLAHISLQPLVLLGLAFLAARWNTLSQLWHRVLLGGATIDFSLGIVLQFGTESHAFDRWFMPGRRLFDTLASYSSFAQMNSRVKLDAGWIFVGDYFLGSSTLVVATLAALLTLALVRAGRSAPRHAAIQNWVSHDDK